MGDIRASVLKLLGDKNYKYFIRNAGKFKFPPNYKFEIHKHSEYEINYINTGSCVMGVGEEYVPLKAGDCIVIRPYISHCFMVDTSKGCSIVQLEYSFSVPGYITEEITILKDDSSFHKFNSCDSLGKVLENVCEAFREQRSQDEFSTALLDLALGQFYVVLSKFYMKSIEMEITVEQGVVAEVIKYINNHIEEELNLEEVAARYKVSTRYIRKYFNQYLGMNCTQYISMLRIARAKELLWNTDKSITDIAMNTGFNSSQYFSRVFSKYTNMTPIEYREMWRGKIAQV